VHQVASVLAPGCVPACLSDGFKGYLPAILGHFGLWTQPERRQDKGPVPKPRWMPLPGLLYAQVVKQYRRKRVVGVQHRVVFGTLDAVKQVLAAYGWKINTSSLIGSRALSQLHPGSIGIMRLLTFSWSGSSP
jgi:hypothetical protein